MTIECEHFWIQKPDTGLRVCRKCYRGDQFIDGEWRFKAYVRPVLIEILDAAEKLSDLVDNIEHNGNGEELLQLTTKLAELTRQLKNETIH